jgi:hypothetical protein
METKLRLFVYILVGVEIIRVQVVLKLGFLLPGNIGKNCGNPSCYAGYNTCEHGASS